MERLSKEQLQRVRTFLAEHGLTFKPLAEDMTDHVACDLEERMSSGASFDQAWVAWLQTLSEQHFKTLQQQTMNTIENRLSASRWLTWLSMGLLFIAMVLRAMHLAGASLSLIASLVLIAMALIVSSLSGISINRERKGAIRVLTVVAGALFMMAGYTFKVLHLPGADQLLVIAVGITLVSVLHNTLYVYKHASGEGNLLTFLHQKHTPGIERFLLILLLPVAAYKIITLLTNDDYFGNFILIIVIFGAGLQFIASLWSQLENNLRLRTPSFVSTFLVAITCFLLPFLGGTYLNLETRIYMIVVFMIGSAWLVFETESRKGIWTSFVFLIPILFIGWALCFLNIIPSSMTGVFFNIPVLVVLLAGTVLAPSGSITRAWMTLITASYLFEYRV